ncbi:A/G-specific adenine glycosylase [Rhodobacteraceae bacterium HSP-20]|uniref:Adenine DNA glycosylase n=1 Tax=Paragemmobacter amnigenus TaxID=2852097 RepID=A0ABS6J2X3_9RHOB|nr:A/G-specific adenine glycosylase [Rhodobacter amnigenus]MBU9697787.1 A/G-specific adenine glycosylase [Rhodobacter amnigenus]MBV4389014.1 A/G-specific adenine glycosylase [Rhodobacter amnigenus]
MRDSDASALAADLLDWYDRNARSMPWRVPPGDRKAGIRPDPYRVWLSEVMLQQTTVAAVRDYFRRFTDRWPTVADLAAAEDAAVMGEWAGLGYYARARNLLACARAVVRDHGGVFPATREGLLTLPGIGPYTASAIAAIAHDEAATVVDGNVERVMSRLWLVTDPLPASKPELTRLAAILTPATRPGDYAQAVMDLGATICTPRNPACGICPWRDPCRARAEGVQATLPRKAEKAAKPVRQGVLWIARRADGAVLVERRAERGLLGGMLGFVGSDWDGAGGDAPLDLPWRPAGEVRHTFTHFHLILTLMVAEAGMDARPRRGEFLPRDAFRPADLPTVMRKAHDLTAAALASP